jgi:hypothetical protein
MYKADAGSPASATEPLQPPLRLSFNLLSLAFLMDFQEPSATILPQYAKFLT